MILETESIINFNDSRSPVEKNDFSSIDIVRSLQLRERWINYDKILCGSWGLKETFSKNIAKMLSKNIIKKYCLNLFRHES